MTPTDPVSLPKVLVVDDTSANRVAMRRLLARMDCELIEASSGNEALSACLDHDFALILLDVQMPEMDGFEVATLLQDDERTQATPVIFVTAAYKDDLHRMHGYTVGAVDYIAKPIDEFILLSKVKVFLELFRVRQALAIAEAKARHLAMHDTLTGLPNRLLFTDRLDSALQRAQRTGKSMALIYLDVDRFKPVNDRYGHAAGDALLRAIAERLRAEMRAVDTVARLGGDEFGIVVESVTSNEEFDALCQRIARQLERPFALDLPGHEAPVEVHVGASLGVARYPQDAASMNDLLRQADARMYARKGPRAR
ncbi:diguanylate cyclase domain-containing protein [Sinimarinibacterium thermocellulolyticum]|uniref:Diguanylate cyclase n=1 Tax=Sinimarinibacterium thermocellulolyticum TaxID=3170016 RepID=A0ABV2AAT6_9GAMM